MQARFTWLGAAKKQASSPKKSLELELGVRENMRHLIGAPPRRTGLFQGLTSDKWVNLAIAALLAFYAIQMILDVAWGTLCGHIGVDYCNNTWATGYIANTLGYAKVYDVRLIGEVERSIFPPTADPALFIVSPSYYLPIFIAPFRLLSRLQPGGGYVAWTALNLAAMVGYLIFFATRVAGQRPARRTLILLCASLPVFFNAFYGNVDVWLMICVGEFLRAWSAGRPLRAGLWLGGLILKPPLLAVICLFALLMRSYKLIFGALATAGTLMAVSLLMVGQQAFQGIMALWLKAAAGSPGIGVESMMNWRMLAVDLSAFTAPQLAWGLASLGALATLILAVQALRQGHVPGSQAWWEVMVVILAASSALAWHSHVHSAIVLLPSLLYLSQRGILPNRVLNIWVLLPAVLLTLVLVPQHMMRLQVLPSSAQFLVYLMRGGGTLGANLYVLWWARHAALSGPGLS
jgi:hypothetical protein